ncbi:MAG: RNA polymerase sigma factor FliA [Methylococcaceae bacterium]|nr:MAG: RNA polymerase sigma factor FliA [Methylococcaceae bacterium]
MSGTTERYGAAPLTDLDALVHEHGQLVKRIAYHLIQRLPPNVQVDDMIQAGMLGLLEAARMYDSTQGASFETYAGIRIRGAMLDEIRRADWAPRSVHRKYRQVSEAMQMIERQTGREARDSEVAEYMGIGLSEYHHILQDGMACRIFSIEEMFEEGDQQWEHSAGVDGGPMQILEQEGFQAALAESIDALPEREKLVVALYYDEELNLKEIGEVLGVSESRVCQIHSQAMLRLRARMQDWKGGSLGRRG